MERKMWNLLEKIAECQAMCKYCFNACLEEDDVRMMTRCIKLDAQCSEICGITISSVAMDGDFSRELLAVCAEACEKCSAECRKHDNLHCMECAKACEDCAKACRAYAA